MHLLYLTEERISFTEPMVRGGAIHVRNVVEGLRTRGHEVTLVDWRNAPERPYQHSLSPRSRFVVDPLRTLQHATTVGREQGVDVVVSKTRKTYLPGLVAAYRLDVPHVVHVGSSLDRPTAGLLDRLDSLSFTTRLRLPHDAYFVVCQHITDQLGARGVPTDRVYDVRNAVDTERFHPEHVPTPLSAGYQQQLSELPAPRHSGGDRLRLGYVGGLNRSKGLGDLAAALDQTALDPTLVVAGDGPDRSRLESIFGDSACFLGSVPYEEVPAVYHAIDAFVLPSRTEGLPRVVLEAQATGTPVVATRVGGVPEVVTDGETGLLCAPGDSDSLAAAVDGLTPERCQRLGSKGREAVESTFAWADLYDRYERFLADVTAADS